MGHNIHRLMASDALFDLATDAIRAHSRHTRRFQSIHTTTEQACLACLATPIGPEQIETMLARLHPKGDRKITLRVEEHWSHNCRQARDKLEAAAGRPLAMREILSCLLQVLLEQETHADA